MRRATIALVLALALVPASAAPAPAGAAELTGSATLVIAKAKARALDNRGIAVEGIRGASSEGRRTRLQVDGGSVAADAADLRLEGALRLVAGTGKDRRAVKLGALRAELGSKSTLSARLNGGERRAVFQLRTRAGGLAADASKGSARLNGAELLWRRAVARAIGRRLGVAIPRGALGKIRISAATLAGLGDDALSIAPKSGPLGDEPPLLPRPVSAVDVTGGSLTWHVRDSWIRYVNTEATPEALEGASAGAPIAEDTHPCPDRPAGTNPTLVYSYSFPFANGWYDAASGTAALYYSGAVRFSYLGHGIDLTARNPEIEINGGASRAIFRMRGAGETPYPDKRASLLSLATTAVPPEGPSSTFAYPAPVRGALTDDGQAVFAGFYPPPNNGFGCIDVSFTTGS